jgi:hypothetical protein
MLKYRIAVSTNKGFTHENFQTKEEVDTWLLNLMEKEEVKRYRIKDMETGEIIETEQGVRNKKPCWEE